MNVQGTAARVQGPQTQSSEPVSKILEQAIEMFGNVESRMQQIRERLQPDNPNRIEKETISATPSGVITQALMLRNFASRLQEKCADLESII